RRRNARCPALVIPPMMLRHPQSRRNKRSLPAFPAGCRLTRWMPVAARSKLPGCGPRLMHATPHSWKPSGPARKLQLPRRRRLRPRSPPQQVSTEAAAAEAPVAPDPVVAKKPPPPRGPVVVVPSADKPKTEARRTEPVNKRKLDIEPGDGDDEARGKKKGA